MSHHTALPTGPLLPEFFVKVTNAEEVTGLSFLVHIDGSDEIAKFVQKDGRGVFVYVNEDGQAVEVDPDDLTTIHWPPYTTRSAGTTDG